MRKMKIFITASITKEILNALKKKFDVIYEPWRETGIIYFGAKELAKKLEGVDIFITEADDLKKKELFEQTNLKLLISCRGDPFNINLQAASKKNIPVLYTPLRNVDSVAELTVGFILMLARKIQIVDRVVHSDEFEIIDFEDYVKHKSFTVFNIKAQTERAV